MAATPFFLQWPVLPCPPSVIFWGEKKKADAVVTSGQVRLADQDAGCISQTLDIRHDNRLSFAHACYSTNDSAASYYFKLATARFVLVKGLRRTC